MLWWTLLTAATGGYLLGSLSTGILLCRLLGLPDPRNKSSGNPGATNVLRFAGIKVALITLLGDSLKGVLAVLLAPLLGPSTLLAAAAGIGAFLGHLYPLFFGFKGGKGVATGLGVLLAFSPLAGALVAVTWLATALTMRYSSLSALLSFLAAPAYIWLQAPAYLWPTLVLSVLLFWRHRENIKRLFQGREARLFSKR